MRRLEIPGLVLAAAALFSFYTWAVYASTFWSPGSIGVNFDGPGTDYMVFYGAVRLFLAGKDALLFEGHRFTAHLNSVFSMWLPKPMPFRPWVYPPTYLLIMLPFGKLTFFPSYVAFQVASAGLLVGALFLGEQDRQRKAVTVAAALLCPAAAWNVAFGQNAFLVCALLIGGFRLCERRPTLGGIVLGLLSFKPQFWMLVPIALVAARDWRALAATLLSAAALASVSAAVLGPEIWWRWLHFALTNYADPQASWTRLGRMWGDDIYACLVASGLPGSLANAAQIAVAALSAGVVCRIFSRGIPPDRKLAVLLSASILAAPQSTPQDSLMLAIAAALWVFGEARQGGAAMWKWTLALALWLIPLFNPPAISPLGRLTPILIVAFMVLLAADRARVAPATTRLDGEPLQPAVGGGR